MPPIAQGIFRGLSWSPFVGLLWLYLFALAATVTRGHFPIPSIDDPKSYHLGLLYHGVWLLHVMNLGGIALWLYLYVIHRWKRVPATRELLVYLLGWSSVFIQFAWDPFHLVYWYMD